MNTNPHQFQDFPKMARLSREVCITEKIDGSNAQIYIADVAADDVLPPETLWRDGNKAFIVGSRTRWITPQSDNFGFARWALEHREELMQLGSGRHFGEWWGSGIQRTYGLKEKRFSLFNVIRWCLHGGTPKPISSANPSVVKMQEILPPCVSLVPELYRGIFTTDACDLAITNLAIGGSVAAPNFPNPEGIVCYHIAAGMGFKKTIKDDGIPKSLVKPV